MVIVPIIRRYTPAAPQSDLTPPPAPTPRKTRPHIVLATAHHVIRYAPIALTLMAHFGKDVAACAAADIGLTRITAACHAAEIEPET